MHWVTVRTCGRHQPSARRVKRTELTAAVTTPIRGGETGKAIMDVGDDGQAVPVVKAGRSTQWAWLDFLKRDSG